MKNRITPVQFSKILSYNPSQIFGLFPQKGCIAIGSDADLVLFDPSYNWNLTCAKTNMGVDWSPYEGWKMQGKVMHTIVRGELVVEDGEFIGCTGRGSFLKRKINL